MADDQSNSPLSARNARRMADYYPDYVSGSSSDSQKSRQAERMAMYFPEQVAPDEENDSWQITKGFKSSIDQTQAIGGGLLAMASDVVGFEGGVKSGLRYYEEQMQEAAVNAPEIESYKDIENVSDALAYGMYQLGSAVPSIATVALGGGIGGVVLKKGAEKITGRMARNATQEQIKKRAVNLARGGGAYVAATGLSTGEIGGSIYEKTGQVEGLTAFAGGAIAGAMEFVMPLRLIRKAGVDTLAIEAIQREAERGLATHMARQGVQNMGIEAITEAAQTIVERASVKWIDENQEIFTEEGWEEIINAGLAGGIAGGGIGSLGGVGRGSRAQAQNEIVRQADAKVRREVRAKGQTPVVPDTSEVEQDAREDAAANGGDALDQENAAAGAAVEELTGEAEASLLERENIAAAAAIADITGDTQEALLKTEGRESGQSIVEERAVDTEILIEAQEQQEELAVQQKREAQETLDTQAREAEAVKVAATETAAVEQRESVERATVEGSPESRVQATVAQQRDDEAAAFAETNYAEDTEQQASAEQGFKDAWDGKKLAEDAEEATIAGFEAGTQRATDNRAALVEKATALEKARQPRINQARRAAAQQYGSAKESAPERIEFVLGYVEGTQDGAVRPEGATARATGFDAGQSTVERERVQAVEADLAVTEKEQAATTRTTEKAQEKVTAKQSRQQAKVKRQKIVVQVAVDKATASTPQKVSREVTTAVQAEGVSATSATEKVVEQRTERVLQPELSRARVEAQETYTDQADIDSFVRNTGAAIRGVSAESTTGAAAAGYTFGQERLAASVALQTEIATIPIVARKQVELALRTKETVAKAAAAKESERIAKAEKKVKAAEAKESERIAKAEKKAKAKPKSKAKTKPVKGAKRVQTGEATTATVTRKRAQMVTDKFKREYPNADIRLIDSPDEMSPEARADFDALPDQGATKGFLYLGKGEPEIYVFPQAHENMEDVQSTIAHEMFGHYGFRALLGKDATKVLLDIFDNAVNQDLLSRIASERGLNPNKLEHRVRIAEEYVAESAETFTEPTLIDRIINLIRKGLKAMGLSSAQSDNDIRMMLAKTRRAIKSADAARQVMDSYSNQGFTDQVKANLRTRKNFFNRASIKTKDFEMTSRFESLISAVQGTDRVPAMAKEQVLRVLKTGHNAADSFLPTLSMEVTPSQYLAQRDTPNLGNLPKQVVDGTTAWSAAEDQKLFEFQPVADSLHNFRKSNRGDYTILTDLIPRASIADVNPRELASTYENSPEQLAAWEIHSKQYNQLTSEGKEMFATYMKTVDTLSREGTQALEDNLVAEGLENEPVIKKLLREFKKRTNYAPVSRFGGYFVAVKEKTDSGEVGNLVAYEMWDHKWDARKSAKVYEDNGYAVEQGDADSGIGTTTAVNAVNREFFKDVINATGTIKNEAQKKSLQNQIFTMWLSSQDTGSFMNRFRKRKGTEGFSTDLVQTFSDFVGRSVKDTARLLHAKNVGRLISEMEAMTDLTGAERGVINQFRARHEIDLNPKYNVIASNLSALGFVMYIGYSVSSALVNMTQVPIMALPSMAAELQRVAEMKGSKMSATEAYTRSAKAIIKIGGLSARAGFRNMQARIKEGKFYLPRDIKQTVGELIAQDGDEFAADTARAYDEFLRDGTISRTLSRSLMEMQKAGEAYRRGLRNTLMDSSAYMFSAAEVFNRENTSLATYRLLRELGQTHEDAVKRARDVTFTAHFDYTQRQRAKLMRGPWMQMFTMFKQHPVNMANRLVFDSADFLKEQFGTRPEGITDEQWSEMQLSYKTGRRRITGMLVMTGIASGAMGLPLVSVMMGLLNMAFGDDDEPYDAETEFRSFLYEMGGENFMRFIADGSINALTNMEVASRVQLNDMFVRPPNTDIEARQWLTYYLGEAAGPVIKSMSNTMHGLSVYREASEMGRGKAALRGLEYIWPKAIKDLQKSFRFAIEGQTTRRGDVVMGAEEFSVATLTAQALGFSPADLNSRYQMGRAISAKTDFIKTRRTTLMSAFVSFAKEGDTAGMNRVIEMVRDFNRANPTYAIDSDSVRASMRSSRRYDVRSYRGTDITPRMRHFVEEMRYLD